MPIYPALDPLYFCISGLIVGAIIGSFIAALVARWPDDRSVMTGRSHCDGCGKTLSVHELFPVISYIIQRGQCRLCGTRIGSDALAIECLAAVIGAASFVLLPLGQGVAGALFGWLLLALAWLDIRYFWLPDRLTLCLAATGLVAAFFLPVTGIADSLIGGIAGYAMLALLSAAYRALRGREGLGGGDAKMLGAIGLWTGWQILPFVLLGASIFGLVSAAVMTARGRAVNAATRLPLGALLAPAAFICWLALALDR